MDRDAVWGFLRTFIDFAAGATTIGVLSVADRCGLLQAMRGAGPMTVADVAGAADVHERYAQEILSALAAAGVVRYDGDDATFSLPDEHAAVVADDASPYAMTGWLDMVPALLSMTPTLAERVGRRDGVALSEFPDDVVRGVDRANGPSFRVLLTRRWLPAMPDVVERLEAGGRAADVGCGSGAAALAMASAYPTAEIVGVDIDRRAIERARARAAEVGVGNVRFEQASVEDLAPDPGFDLVTALDVVHDLARPQAALERIRAALRPGGALLMMEPNLSSDLEDNLHPTGALFYGISTLHCLTQSLAADGAGLGAAWGERRAQRLCAAAGFTRVERLPIDNPFSAFYRVEA